MNNQFLGFGLGARTQHFQQIVDGTPDVDWFEFITENYMVEGGKPRWFLDRIRERYPVVLHGVSLSIGSTDELDYDYLKRMKKLISEVEPQWVSDHLCFTGAHGYNSHDLLPLPYTEEALQHVVQRIRQVQDILERPVLMENVSSYITYRESHMTEWEFLNAVAMESGCYLLLDINNIYVSARNHDFIARDYINGIEPGKVKQFHLAGHSDYGDYVIDTHDHDVCDSVWQLYREALQRFGSVSTMIERDANIPALSELLDELDVARSIYDEVIGSNLKQVAVI